MFLWKKHGRNSKTSFWFFMIMAPVVLILWVVAVRLALVPDEYFTEALVSGGGFTGLITALIGRLYLRRRDQDNGHETDTASLEGAGWRETE